MRKVLRNTDEVIHVFAQQTQSEGRNQSKNIFFEGTRIYSYGYHYLLGEFIDKETILINDKGYSITTAKHINSLSGATSHKRKFFTTRCKLEFVHPTIKDYLQKLPRAKSNKGYYLREVFDLYKGFNEYLEYTKTKTKVSKLKEYKELKKIVARLETDKEQILLEIAEQNKKRYQRQQEKQKEQIQEFRTYKRNYLHNLPQSLLRLSLDKTNIETSKGVKIEVKKAKVLYKLIEAGKDINGFELDYYTVIGIKDNILKIGCHNIPLQEVNTIGKQLIKL